MAFPENLQYIRKQADITQEQLAEQLQVSRQSVSKWESGGSFPEMDTLLRICDLYDVKLDTLLRGSIQESLLSDTAGYNAHMDLFSKQVAGAVGAIIAAVSAMMLLLAAGLPEILATAFLLLVITVSVVILIAGGIQHDHFCQKHPTVSDCYTPEEKEAFHQKFVWLIAGGVGAILFGVVLLVCFSMLPETDFYESLSVGIFLLIIAGSVTGFIYGGMQEEKYQVWKYNRDNNPTPEAKAQLQKSGTVCGVIMLLTTALYVGLGLARDAWDTAWWLFAVGGILCAVAGTILNPYKGDE